MPRPGQPAPDAARADARIVLVRHGRPTLTERGWHDAVGLRRWLAAYDAAGLADDSAPPAELVALAARAGLVATSDLRRAYESAARLAPDAPVVHSPLLRETPPPFPGLGGVRLPFAGWALAVGARMAYDGARGRPGPAGPRRQAHEAAGWLAGLADAHGLVVAVTHGWVRGLIAEALAERGWGRAAAPRGPARRFGHWSAWAVARGPAGGR